VREYLKASHCRGGIRRRAAFYVNMPFIYAAVKNIKPHLYLLILAKEKKGN